MQTAEQFETIVVKRVIAASASDVWRAWTTPALKKKWWGRSENLTLVECEMDVRPGGHYRYAMAPAGSDVAEEAAHGVYQLVEPERKLVYSWTWGGDNPSVENTLVTVLFNPLSNNETEVTVTHERQPSAKIAKIHTEGWTHMLLDLESFSAAPVA